MAKTPKTTDAKAKVAKDSKSVRGCAALSAKGVRLGGRQKGVPNKATTTAREAISTLLDGNAHRVADWLNQVAETDPKGALAAFTALLEFGVPKLARTELTGGDGKSEPVRVEISYISPNPKE